MKKFFLLNKIFNFLIIIFCACLFSCDTLWNGDLKERLVAETQTKIHFYSNKEENLTAGETLYMTERSYRIGSTISAKDMPEYDNSEIVKWTSDYRLGGWKYYRWTSSKEEIADSSLINSMTVTADEVDLYAVWFSKYVVIYNYQTTDGLNYDDAAEVYYGEPGTVTNLNPPVIPGFKDPSFSNATIADNGTTEITVTYDRKSITLTLDANGGTVEYGGTSGLSINVSGLYGSAFDKSSVAVTPPATGLVIAGWSPALPDTFPADDATYTAIYTGKEFNIDYMDYNNFITGSSDFNGNGSSLPVTYKCGTKSYIPSPSSTVLQSENTVEFAGWYKEDNTGSLAVLDSDAGGYYIDATTTGDITLYAKWKAKYIYVDPASGNDDNDSFTSSTALKTIAKAKDYLADASLASPAIRVLSTISDSGDLADLNGLSTSAYNNAILQKASQLTGALLEINSGTCTLSEITIDGGNSSSSAPAIVVDGGELTLGDSSSVTNFNLTSGAAGLIKLTDGTLNLEGTAINGNTIANGYAVYHSSSSSTLTMGGATQIDISTPVYLGDGCNIKITSNLTEDSVAKIFAEKYTELPYVLVEDTSGTYISSNYTKFASAHDGYKVMDNGQLAIPAELTVDFADPDLKVYELGSLEGYTGSVSISGTKTVTFKVNSSVYSYLTGGNVYVQVFKTNSVSALVFSAYATVDSTNYTAEVDLVDSITSSGQYRAVIYGVSNDSNVYFERVYLDVLILP
ncbi:MAG: hypothetical protein ACI4LX_06265 [Treponema sp.]